MAKRMKPRRVTPRIPPKAYQVAMMALLGGSDFGAAWACMNKPGFSDLPDSGEGKTKMREIIHEAAIRAMDYAVESTSNRT